MSYLKYYPLSFPFSPWDYSIVASGILYVFRVKSLLLKNCYFIRIQKNHLQFSLWKHSRIRFRITAPFSLFFSVANSHILNSTPFLLSFSQPLEYYSRIRNTTTLSVSNLFLDTVSIIPLSFSRDTIYNQNSTPFPLSFSLWEKSHGIRNTTPLLLFCLTKINTDIPVIPTLLPSTCFSLMYVSRGTTTEITLKHWHL